MATRIETSQRRRELYNSLRRSCRDGSLRQGQLLPSVRELAQQYQISVKLVCATLAVLVEEGVLTSVPRIGTFVGQPPSETTAPELPLAPFLLLSIHSRGYHPFFSQIQAGFEDHIAQLGGTSLTLSLSEVEQLQAQNRLPELSGIFCFESGSGHEITGIAGIPRVNYGTSVDVEGHADRVDFDDEEGGTQATRFLLNIGHRNIAFLALHSGWPDDNEFYWSVRREAGWQKTMEEAGFATQNLVFRPAKPNTLLHADQIESAYNSANQLMKSTQITAVIVANLMAAEGLLKAFHEADIHPEKWPAIICFDSAPEGLASIISSLRLPWERIGTEGAQLLWERKTGRLTGPTQERLVKMNLIPRLTSRPDWIISHRENAR